MSLILLVDSAGGIGHCHQVATCLVIAEAQRAKLAEMEARVETLQRILQQVLRTLEDSEKTQQHLRSTLFHVSSYLTDIEQYLISIGGGAGSSELPTIHSDSLPSRSKSAPPVPVVIASTHCFAADLEESHLQNSTKRP